MKLCFLSSAHLMFKRHKKGLLSLESILNAFKKINYISKIFLILAEVIKLHSYHKEQTSLKKEATKT